MTKATTLCERFHDMSRAVNIRMFVAILGISVAACAGHPVSLGIYTPKPAADAMSMVRAKIVDLGYTIEKENEDKSEIVASKPLDPPSGGANREEMRVQVAQDLTGSTKVNVTVARIVPATASSPQKRVAAGSKGNADGNAIIYLFMKK